MMAADIPSRTVAGPNLMEMNNSLIEKAVFTAGINNRTGQDIPFPFTSPSVADVPIDTSFFTSPPTARFYELLQQNEDPTVSVSDTLQQTPQKVNLPMLSLDGVETNVVTSVIDTNTNANSKTPPDICTCLATEIGDEVPVEQVFLGGDQMYRVPEAGVITLANIEFHAFIKNNQWYISPSMLYHAVGPEAKKHLEKALLGADRADRNNFWTMTDNEYELLAQQTGLADGALELISVSFLQAICQSISQTVEVAAIRSIAFDDVYVKVLGNNVRCSKCGMIIKKDPVEEKYVVIWSQSMCNAVVPNGIPFTVGTVYASNAKFYAFQMNDKTYINLAELVRFKMFTWTSIQRKLNTLNISAVSAPAGVEEQFASGATLGKGQWIDLVNLRCCCCMGNGKCTIKGHSEEVWRALKMGQCTYEAGKELIAMDETQDAVDSIAVNEPESETMSPTSTVTFINSQSNVNDGNDGCLSNGSEEHVSSTTDGFVPGTPYISSNEDHLEQRSETVNYIDDITVKKSETVTINTTDSPVSLGNEGTINEVANNITEFHITQPNGEMVAITVKDTEEVDTEEISRQFGFKLDQNELENNKTYSENVENVREGVIEVVDHSSVSKEMNDSSNTRADFVENRQVEFQDYFIGRPRGRPMKSQDAFVFKPPVEKSVKRGRMYLFPGDCIVPDLEELNRQIENKKVIIGSKNLTSEVMNEKSIADCIEQQKASTAKMSSSGQKTIKQTSKFSEPQTNVEDINSDSKQDIKPLSSDNNDADKTQTIAEHTSNVNIHSEYRAEQSNFSNSQNEKVVIEYLQSRTEQDEQKLIAHEKEVEKAEICVMPSRSNSNTPEKVQITVRSKVPEQSTVARNIWPDSQSGASQFTSPLVNSSTSDPASESFHSPVAGVFTSTQVSNTPRTPPAWNVERLAKLTSSKSFSGPDAALLTLATLAAENESTSEQEQDQTDTKTKRPDENISDTMDETVEQIYREKDQMDGHENKATEKDSGLDVIKPMNKRNSETEPTADISQTDKEEKLELISRLKKLAIFTWDKENSELTVKRFTKQAKVEFPELFDGSDSEEIRTQFALVLSCFVTNNYHKFLQERRERNHKNTVEKSKEKLDLGVSESFNADKNIGDEFSKSVTGTEVQDNQSKTDSASYSQSSVQNTQQNLTQDLQLEIAVKSITTNEDENMDKTDKIDPVPVNPTIDNGHEKVKRRGRPRKQKLDITKHSTSNSESKGQKESQVKDPIIKSKETENDAIDKKIKEKDYPSVQSHEPLVVRIVRTKGKETKRTKKPKKLIQNMKLSNKSKAIGKKRKRVDSEEAETETAIDTSEKLEVEEHHDNKDQRRKHSDDKGIVASESQNINAERVDKLVIKTDKTGMHVHKLDDKHKNKHSAETCSNDKKRKRLSLDDDDIQKSLQNNDSGKNDYDNATESETSLSKNEVNNFKVKPLKIKLGACKKVKQQKGQVAIKSIDKELKCVEKTPNENEIWSIDSEQRLPDVNSNGKLHADPVVHLKKVHVDKSSVFLSDEEMVDCSYSTGVTTAESESDDTISEEKLKFFRAVSLVGPVTGLAFHSGERQSRSPIKAVKDTRLSRSRSESPSKSPVKKCVKDDNEICEKLFKAPNSKKKKLSKCDDKASQKPSKSPTRKSSKKKQITPKGDLKIQLIESNSVNKKAGTTSRKHSKSPEKHKKEKKTSDDNDLIEQRTENDSLNSSTGKTNKKHSKSSKRRAYASEETQTSSSSKSERKMSRSPKRTTERNLSQSPQRCSPRKEKKPLTDNNKSKSPVRNCSNKHASPKRSPKKS